MATQEHRVVMNVSRVSRRCALALSLVACSSELQHAAVPVVDAAISTGRCRERQCLASAGTFVMGSPETEFLRARYGEEQRDVTLTHALAVDQFEVTQAEWESSGYPNRAGRTRNSAGGGRDCTDPACPASSMTWLDAVAYANERSRREGRQTCIDLSDCTGAVGVDFVCRSYRQTTASYYDCEGYRLPTLAEFQYVARAGTTTTFYSGPFQPAADSCVKLEHLMAAAWYCANSDNHTHPVGERLPNAWGLHDMLGNAAEFNASRPDTVVVAGLPQVDPHSRLDDAGIVSHAGGLFFGDPSLLRAAGQTGQFNALTPDRTIGSGVGGGFRLVRSLSAAEAAAWRP